MQIENVIDPIHWSSKEYQQFGLAPQISEHDYHKMPMFQNNNLIDLLDNYPREHLQAHSMGADPQNYKEWIQVDIAPESSGADIWRAVEHGRIWLNLVHIEKNRREYRELINAMYEHLGENCPHLQNPTSTFSALLISSPGAQVYYHLDAEPNMLWHMRGKKDVWLYPAMDPELMPQEFLEDIYSGEIDEDLPYKPEFDDRALYHRLVPGEAASWAHNAPHRIMNVDMNVSLATSYYTPAVYKRQYVQLANRHLLRNIGIQNRSMAEHGLVPSAKRFSYRVINKIRPFKNNIRSANYITDLQLDPDAPLGFRKLPEAKLASFAKPGPLNS